MAPCPLRRLNCRCRSQDELRSRGVKAAPYHAEMEAGARQKTHAAWSKGSVHVVVATTAFGLGINKPDVRFVIHHSISKALESYYQASQRAIVSFLHSRRFAFRCQEAGRAGRDGNPAHALAYFKPADFVRQRCQTARC